MKKARAKIRVGGYKSSLERNYAAMLDVRYKAGEIQWYSHEPLSIRLGKGCFYMPDFIVIENDGTVLAVEIKGGHIRRVSSVKFKAAAEKYPWIAFEMWQYTKALGWKLIMEER